MKVLPNFLYESLPYLYVACGLFSMAKIPGKLSLASGLLMLCIGIVVFRMRKAYRAEAREGARLMMAGK